MCIIDMQQDYCKSLLEICAMVKNDKMLGEKENVGVSLQCFAQGLMSFVMSLILFSFMTF